MPLPPGDIIGALMRREVRSTVALLVAIAATTAQGQAPTDPVERSMDYVAKSAEATDLFNEGHYAEALPLFRLLTQSYSDQDTDGYAALGLGDCLAALGRLDEARAFFQSLPTPDALRQESIRSRIEELELKGTITDLTLNRLRAALAAAPPNAIGRFSSAWRLGRALQKRTADLLVEASQAFRIAAGTPGEKPCPADQLINHSAYLDELVGDLKFLIDEVESHLNMPRNFGPDIDKSGDKPITEERHVQQTIKLPDGRRVQIQIEQPVGGLPKVKVDGKEVQLTAAQRRLLQRHQDQENAIIREAAEQTAASSAGRAAAPQ